MNPTAYHRELFRNTDYKSPTPTIYYRIFTIHRDRRLKLSYINIGIIITSNNTKEVFSMRSGFHLQEGA